MNAIITVSIGKKYSDIGNITHSSMKRYADKIGADFIVIDVPMFTQSSSHWEKFQIYNYFKDYERILFLDTDIIVRKDCPNLFDMVPRDQIGMFNEGRFESRYQAIMETTRTHNCVLPDWDGTYYNSGVMVLSRYHKELFANPNTTPLPYADQSWINLKILMEPVRWPVCQLSYKFNRMTLLDQFGESRYGSYIIHYAGSPNFDILMNIIELDISVFENTNDFSVYNKKNIIVDVKGGLGDQTCCEPAVRYFTNMHKSDNITVITDFPMLFNHLKTTCSVAKRGDALPLNPNSCFIISPIPDYNASPIWGIAPPTQCHLVDFACLNLCGQMIPDDDKLIKLEVSNSGLEEISHIDTNKLVLVHPGLGWDSKTFPKEWWEEIVQGLVNRCMKVAVIGKYVSDGNSTNRNGVIDINIPEGAIDLTNCLTVDGLIALISKAEILVSNDSGPIHIAGAFRNGIVLLPSCKHPDNVLPYRRGFNVNKYFNARAVYEKLTNTFMNSSPLYMRLNGHVLDYMENDILDYIPEPDRVIKNITLLHSMFNE